MSNVALAKPVLPPGFLDASIGEGYLIRDALFDAFHIDPSSFHHKDSFDYPCATGYGPLVKLLEEKHNAPIVITNGAKQGLGAMFFALKKMGFNSIGMRVPYWALIPPMIEMHGMKWNDQPDCFLSVAPNNPDGFLLSADQMRYTSALCKDLKIPLIHDAVYYTPVYTPDNYELIKFGDCQLFSLSKSFGLSGLRIGYVVCHNRDYFSYVREYVEAMTSGVSTVAQTYAYDILKMMKENPIMEKDFQNIARKQLLVNKKIAMTIHSSVLEVPANMDRIPGMFLWAKAGPKLDLYKAKINAIAGDLFGVPGMVRINLALPNKTMQELVDRLNLLV